MVWDKAAVNKFVAKMYREFECESNTFSMMKKNRYVGFITQYYDLDLGVTDPNRTAHIQINHRWEIIPTVIHECVHKIYPTWTETMVEVAEKKIMRHISPIQAKNILKRFAATL